MICRTMKKKECSIPSPSAQPTPVPTTPATSPASRTLPAEDLRSELCVRRGSVHRRSLPGISVVRSTYLLIKPSFEPRGGPIHESPNLDFAPCLRRNVSLRQSDRTPELAGRHVDQHQVPCPRAEPVLVYPPALGFPAAVLPVEPAYPKPLDYDLASVIVCTVATTCPRLRWPL
jgi:hypothetical protein